MWDIILDAVLDTLKVFPFLLIVYLLIELIENKTTFTKDHKLLQGGLAPLIGTATGLVPQCGFSVFAAKLYDRGFIRTGTLLAVFLATSDEAFILLLTSNTSAVSLMPLILIKLVVAVGVGYLVNFLLSNERLTQIEEHDHDHEHDHELHAYSCGREHEGKSSLQIYLIDPLLHSLKITLYLLIVNLVLGFLIDAVGEENISSTLIGGPYVQPFIAGLIGLIPNCASSVIITETYIGGGIMFGSCVAGLCANAGLGMVVLLKNTKKIKRNVLLLIVMYLVATLVGLAVNGIMIATGISF